MGKITLAALASFATLATFTAAPAFATGYGNSYGHSGYSSYGHGHSYGHKSYSYQPSYRAPTYHAPTYHAPTYYAPTYHAPKYEAPKPTTSYETRPAYVYQKVAGYCTDVVKSYGYNAYRKTVECKAGDAPKAEHKPVEPKTEEPPK